MRRLAGLAAAGVLAVCNFIMLADAAIGALDDVPGKDLGWKTEFPLEKDELATTGRNPFFILEPGYFLVLEKGTEKIEITVLNETKMVGDFETRVVEEKETKNGKPTEISRNYYAISKKTKNVYYFGEVVDVFENGKIESHEGSWLHGKNGAKFGLAMPGKIVLKAKYYQEQAPKVAMDRAENISMSETIETPAGTFKDCLKVEETTPLEPENREFKYYAPGIGLVSDGSSKLTKYGFKKD